MSATTKKNEETNKYCVIPDEIKELESHLDSWEPSIAPTDPPAIIKP